MRFILILLLICCSTVSYATHIRAGEIIAKLVSCQAYTYRFEVIGYEDTGSDVEFGNGEINFGDGSETVLLSTETSFFDRVIVDPHNLVRRSRFVIEHVFPGPGTYTIRFREFNRNADIRNMAHSVETPFYIETTIVIDPLLACNNSPILTNPPVDGAAIGVKFIHNPGAYDPDGDSLSYHFVVPKQDVDLPVDGYNFPDTFDIRFGDNPNPTNQNADGPPTLTLDPVTGDLIWDAPNSVGEFNVAFIIQEWRLIDGEWVSLGYVTRDMQILVEDANNEPPILEVPEDICVEVGTPIQEIIRATDPDNNRIIIEAFGEIFEIPNAATFGPEAVQLSPAQATLNWTPSCLEVRNKPYLVHFKAADVNPASGPSLADFKSFNITVVASAPKELTSEIADGRSINLSWQEYQCSSRDSIKIEIWRKVDGKEMDPDNCEVGMPQGSGFELIAMVDQSVVAFRDKGLAPGANYCYRLVARFPDGSVSYVSTETCAYIKIDAPVLTKVDVVETSDQKGVIQLEWMGPLEIDSTLFPPPYFYQLFRDGVAISEIQADTVFTDQNLNTQNQVYSYHVLLFDQNQNLIDSSAQAQSVKLELTSSVGSIELNWKAQTPWSIQSTEHPYHYVYRSSSDNPEHFELLDSVNVVAVGLTYFDHSGLSDQLTYCYYVDTRGSYGNPKIYAPLINKSQIACAQPNDTIPPCQPAELIMPELDGLESCEAQIQNQDCGELNLKQTISWTGANTDCSFDVASYQVYFSATSQEADFEMIAQVADTFFIHQNLTSLTGCYKVKSIDRSGNSSEFTEQICNDNCPRFELPNVFTPNDDGQNDTFRPLGTGFDFEPNVCPRFVKSVRFQVHNRLGKTVHEFKSEQENSIYIDWDGTHNGKLLPAGLYYYICEVEFDAIEPTKKKKTIKGWVQILYRSE